MNNWLHICGVATYETILNGGFYNIGQNVKEIKELAWLNPIY